MKIVIYIIHIIIPLIVLQRTKFPAYLKNFLEEGNKK